MRIIRIRHLISGSLASLCVWTTVAAQDATILSPIFQTGISDKSIDVSATWPVQDHKSASSLTSDDQQSHLSFEQDPDPGLGQWQRKMTFKGQTQSKNGITFAFDGDIQDRRRILELDAAGLLFGGADKWEENTVGRTKLRVGALDDRVRVTLQYGWSNYTGPSPYLKEHSKKDSKGETQFWRQDDTEGMAFSQRVDLDVLKYKQDLSVSVFGEYRLVSPYFEAIENKNQNDIFGEENHEDIRYGTILGLGPATLTLGLVQSQKARFDEGDSAYPRKVLYDSNLALDLGELRQSLGGSADHPIWSFGPQSIWMNYSKGKIEFEDGSSSPEDATTDFSVGASWYPGSANIDVSFWHSFYDGRQIGAESSDWIGKGIEFGYGLNGAWWSFGGQISAGRYESLEEDSNSTDHSLDGSLWLALEPEDLPAFSTNVSLGRYASRYRYASLDYSYDSVSQSDHWEASAALDFSRYLPQRWQDAESRLKLFYILEGNNYREEDVEGSSANISENAHVFVARFSTQF